MPDVELARRPDVELIRTGQFQTLTGSWNPTPADIKAAVEAMDCPAIRKPVIRIGHTDQRFAPKGDGEPALGWFENLRAADDGQTLIADQVTLPWLHSVQAAAYPSRSIEGNYRHRCSEGHVHPFVIHTVALLGVTPPGVQTLRSLNDLPEMLGVAASGEVPEGAEHVQVTVMAAAEAHTGAMVALIPAHEDAERLTVEGGLAVEEIHLTLAYLGEAEALGAAGRQDVIDAVSRAANGLPVLNADVFSAAVFNPGNANDRDACLVYLVSGDPIDAVHDLVDESLFDVLWPMPSPIPAQHRPWFAHVTGVYTDDLGRIGDLAARMGPIRFDRIRLAFAGEVIDIPLIPDGEQEDTVAASAADNIRGRIAGLRQAREGKEQPVSAAAEDTPPEPDPAPILPAAEPEPENTDPKEDPVSTDLSAFRSRLGLADDADESAITAAIDALKTKADTPAERTPEMVAASAAAESEKDELRKEVTVLASQVQTMSARLAEKEAATAATVKASVLDEAQRAGKFAPAEREQWNTDYDQAPGAVTRVLAAIAVGAAVPVAASGTVGSPEPAGSDAEWDDIVSRLDAPKAA